MTDPTPPTTHERHKAPQRCSGCAAVLAGDQRYCLRCGLRRGKPRIDFIAFWKPPTSGRPNEQPGVHEARPFRPGVPSRRFTSALLAGVLAVGIVTGAALGPAPPNSPADNSTIVQRALAALAAQASGGTPQLSPPATPAAAPHESASATAGAAKSIHKAAPHQQAASTEANAASPSESSSSSESTNGSKHSGSARTGEGEQAAPGKSIKLPPIQHVWLITLGGSTLAEAAAAPTSYPYLVGQLIEQGVLLTGYSALDGYELAGDAALLPGGVGASLSVISEPRCGAAPTPGVGNTCAEGAQPSPSETDAFIQQVVGPIIANPAYREDGLIVITFASASSSTGVPATTLALQPAAGALLLSPLLNRGTRSSNRFDSLSPRTSLETIFGH